MLNTNNQTANKQLNTKIMTDDIQTEAQQFIQNNKSLLLATIDSDSEPDCSTTPFIRDDQGDLYIFISELAKHTKNLFTHPKASVMILEDESAARNVFARKRLILQVTAEPVPKEDQNYQAILDAMQTQLGNTMEVLRSLPDFHLIRLQVGKGNYVQGFAQAYSVQGPELELIEHRRS